MFKFASKNFHKLIIENSSDEKLKKELEQNYDKTNVILSNNIGMGAGNNLGIIKSSTQYVYVLNPDVILKEDTLSSINNSISDLKILQFYHLSLTIQTIKLQNK